MIGLGLQRFAQLCRIRLDLLGFLLYLWEHLPHNIHTVLNGYSQLGKHFHQINSRSQQFIIDSLGYNSRTVLEVLVRLQQPVWLIQAISVIK